MRRRVLASLAPYEYMLDEVIHNVMVNNDLHNFRYMNA
jgi:hypothetical protein